MKNNYTGDYLLLYSNCLTVKGISRSVIVDTQRGEMYFIDNTLFDILAESKKRVWADICNDYDDESQEMLLKYVEFLEGNELCLWANNPENFPDINLEWESPSLITNAIIDYDKTSNHNWKNIFDELIDVGCRDIQLRFFEKIEKEIIEEILLLVDNSYIKSLEIILQYNPLFTKKYLTSLIEENIRIKYFTFYNSPKDELYRYGDGTGMGNIIYIKDEIESSNHCGIINIDYFALTEPRTFAEFKNFNSCLNRKIGIDINGDIKNCPSLKTVYGNIRKDKIRNIISEEFKEVWFIKKDQIETCKICEFRYVCSDCRAFTTDNSNLFSKPEKCGYDPISMEWK